MLTKEMIDARFAELTGAISDHHKKSNDRLDAFADFHKRVDGRLTEIEQHLVAGNGYGRDTAPTTLGQQMVDSAEFKSLVTRGRGTARIEVKTTLLSTSGSAGPLAPVDQRLEPYLMPRRRLRIRDLLSQGNTISNSVRYVQQTGRDVTAGVQTEGSAKREAAITFENQVANVATIAVWIPASKQILDDAPALAATIDAELRYGVDLKEEDQILNGDGTDVNLLGLIPSATAYNAPFVVEASQYMDKILLAQAQLEAADFEATAVALNPLDWARMRATKDSQERYIAGGPLSGAPRQLWDLPVVASNSLAEGEFLVGDFKRAGLLLDRQTMVVEISTEHDDFFTRNLIAIRAEKRVALVIGQPSALVYGDFSTAT